MDFYDDVHAAAKDFANFDRAFTRIKVHFNAFFQHLDDYKPQFKTIESRLDTEKINSPFLPLGKSLLQNLRRLFKAQKFMDASFFLNYLRMAIAKLRYSISQNQELLGWRLTII